MTDDEYVALEDYQVRAILTAAALSGRGKEIPENVLVAAAKAADHACLQWSLWNLVINGELLPKQRDDGGWAFVEATAQDKPVIIAGAKCDRIPFENN